MKKHRLGMRLAAIGLSVGLTVTGCGGNSGNGSAAGGVQDSAGTAQAAGGAQAAGSAQEAGGDQTEAGVNNVGSTDGEKELDSAVNPADSQAGESTAVSRGEDTDPEFNSESFDMTGLTFQADSDAYYSTEDYKSLKKIDRGTNQESVLYKLNNEQFMGLAVGDKNIYFGLVKENDYGEHSGKVMEISKDGGEARIIMDSAPSYGVQLEYEDGVLFAYSTEGKVRYLRVEEGSAEPSFSTLKEFADAKDMQVGDPEKSRELSGLINHYAAYNLMYTPTFTHRNYGYTASKSEEGLVTVTFDDGEENRIELNDNESVEGFYKDRMIIQESTDVGGEYFYIYSVIDLRSGDRQEIKNPRLRDASIIAVDGEGLYARLMDEGETENGDGVTSVYKISWDGENEEFIASSPEPEIESFFPLSKFIAAPQGYYYNDVEDYAEYIFFLNRNASNKSEAQKIGTAVNDTHISDVGHIETERKVVMVKGTEDKPAMKMRYSRLVLDSSDEAAQKINDYLEAKQKESIESSTKEGEEMGDYAAEDEMDYYTLNNYVSEYPASIEYMDDRFLSVLMGGYWYGGGAHGMPISYYYVFDRKTGEKLELTDIVNNSDSAIMNIVAGAFEELYEQSPDAYNSDMVESVQKKKVEELPFGMTKDGITITFPPYELASYATGFVGVVIPFEKFSIDFEPGNENGGGID